jgi:hypothetical protein
MLQSSRGRAFGPFCVGHIDGIEIAMCWQKLHRHHDDKSGSALTPSELMRITKRSMGRVGAAYLTPSMTTFDFAKDVAR